MTFQAAIRKAKLEGASMIFQLSKPWYHRGIRLPFTKEEIEAKDWAVFHHEASF